jgi:hypothetical protein
MKKNQYFFLIIVLLVSEIIRAQVSIGTTTPDSSSLLDLYSTSKGLLIPRMTTNQRDLIVAPANGLMVFNTDSNTLEINTGTVGIKTWNVISNGAPSSVHSSVFNTETTTTNSLTDVLVPDMTLSPAEGTYFVSFNSQFNNDKLAVISTTSSAVGTAKNALDLQVAYDQLMAIPVTDATHIPAMGSNETIYPGVYSFIAAASIAGKLTLDAKGDSNALFVFKIGGAFAAGAATTIVLANGAESRNIFWVSEGSPSIGAACTIKGTMIAHAGAGAVGAGSIIEGRMFTIAGALTFGPATISVPTGVSSINLGSLSNFVLFTSTGDVSNTADSIITGNIGTNLGVVTGLEISIVNGSVFTPSTPIVPTNPITTTTYIDNNNKVNASFSIYQNNVLIPSSEKILISNSGAANISLQAIAVVNGNQPIEVRWKTGSDKLLLGNRILTVLKVQ